MKRNKIFTCVKDGNKAIAEIEVEDFDYQATLEVNNRTVDSIDDAMVEGDENEADFELSHEDFSAHITIKSDGERVPDIRCTWK